MLCTFISRPRNVPFSIFMEATSLFSIKFHLFSASVEFPFSIWQKKMVLLFIYLLFLVKFGIRGLFKCQNIWKLHMQLFWLTWSDSFVNLEALKGTSKEIFKTQMVIPCCVCKASAKKIVSKFMRISAWVLFHLILWEEDLSRLSENGTCIPCVCKYKPLGPIVF